MDNSKNSDKYYNLQNCYLGGMRGSQDSQKVYEHFPYLFGQIWELIFTDLFLTRKGVFLRRINLYLRRTNLYLGRTNLYLGRKYLVSQRSVVFLKEVLCVSKMFCVLPAYFAFVSFA